MWAFFGKFTFAKFTKIPKMMRTIHSFLALLLLGTMVVFSSCKDDPDPDEITSDYYFQANIDGTLRTFQFDRDDYINIIGDWGQGSDAAGENQYIPFTCIASEDALTQSDGINNSGAIGVIIATTDELTAEQTGERIVSGDIGYGTRSYDAGDEAVPGGFISYVDGAGTEWTSNGDQTGGSFRITEYGDFNDPDNFTHKVITAEFSGTLYNGTGGSVSITDGICRGRMILY